MTRYILDTETKTIELQSSGTMQELKDLYELYKDYTFSIAFSAPKNTLEKQGMVVGAQYVSLIGKIDHN